MASCFHCLPLGKVFLSKPCDINNINIPAIENLMNEIVNGWADAKPSFDATEAEAHMAANGKPMIQKRSGWS